MKSQPNARPITLVAWEDATKKKPEEERLVLTDAGLVAHFDGIWYDRFKWRFNGPNPSVWTEIPTPPGPDALTVEDLRRIGQLAQIGAAELWGPTDHSENREHYQAEFALIIRLRGAIAALAALPTPPEEDANG